MAEFKVFVYGTLKEGRSNHGIIKDSEFIKETRIKGTLFSNFFCPFVSLEGDYLIEGEVYLVDENTLKRLDALEGFPEIYHRSYVRDEDGELVWVYHIERAIKGIVKEVNEDGIQCW